MSYVDQPPKWRVGEFWSSADPDRKVLVIAEGKEIVSYPSGLTSSVGWSKAILSPTLTRVRWSAHSAAVATLATANQ